VAKNFWEFFFLVDKCRELSYNIILKRVKKLTPLLFILLFILPREQGYLRGGTVVVKFGRCPTLVGEIVHFNGGNVLLGRGTSCVQEKKMRLGTLMY